MARIKNIVLKNFRNFTKINISFNNKSNIFFGDNGTGKTNILEAISLLTKGRGIRNATIHDLIKKSNETFLVKSNIEINKNDYEIDVYTKKENERLKKVICINDDDSKESNDFLNESLSYLVFLPEMERLFQSSPSNKRNFIDRLIFSEKNNYNKLINRYKKNIFERNKLLQNNTFDEVWIKQIENEISSIGLEIYELRNSQITMLNLHIENLNKTNDFQFDIVLKIKDNFYNSNLNHQTYLNYLMESREFDKQFGGTKIGPHRSDIVATINNKFDGSQLSTGQQKTIVLMILLAQCNYLVNSKKISPILLLDEICSHLDSNNRKILLDIMNKFDLQLFLTGTEKTLFSFMSTNVKFYNITEL